MPVLHQIKQADNFLSKLYNNLMSLHNSATALSVKVCLAFLGRGTDNKNKKKKARKLGPKASQLDNDDYDDASQR